jgi:hypothetical protein
MKNIKMKKRTNKNLLRKMCAMMLLLWSISAGMLKANSMALFESGDTITHTDSEYPLRGIFYYAWYPNTWSPNGYHVQYHPTIGYYTSIDYSAINHHITELDYANVDVAIASWWGLDNSNRIPRDTAINRAMKETDRRTENGEIDLKWAIYYELEAFYDEPMDTVKADLEYLMERYVKQHKCYAHVNGKPVIFVYTSGSVDNTAAFMKKWADAVDGKWYYVLKVFGGYKDMPYQPDSWHQYGPSTRVHKMTDSSGKLVSVNISPGFKHADPNKDTFLERADRTLWTDVVKDMVASGADWQLVTSYNEWGEGTAIESAAEWQTHTGFGMYQDVLHMYSTVDDLSKPDNTILNAQHDMQGDFPYTISNRTLQINNPANKVIIYSITGQVISQKRNCSSLSLESDQAILIIKLEIGDKMYQLKYINL